MTQFDILSLEFNFTSDDDTASQLCVTIDNPDNMGLLEPSEHGAVPDNVEIVAAGQQPTQDLWVYADHHHLTITLDGSGESTPIEVTNTGYFNEGGDLKYVDIIVADKTPDKKKKKARKIRRQGVIVSY